MSDNSLRPMRPIKRTPFVEEVLPIHDPEKVHKPAKHAPAAPHKPCAGFGLNTPANEKESAHGFKHLQQAWPKLSDVQRRSRIEELANAQLQKSGVPKVKMVKSTLPTDDGQFNYRTWSLTINKNLLNKNALSEPQAKDLANTVYHESRHAEQFYLIAQQKAAVLNGTPSMMPDQQATEIKHTLGIPSSTAQKAQKQPLDVHDRRNPCAQALDDSLYGAHAAHHNNVLNNQDAAILADDHATAHYENVNRDYEKLRLTPNANPTAVQKAYEGAMAAQKQMEAADAVRQKAFQAYQRLPEEADALETGDAVEKWL